MSTSFREIKQVLIPKATMDGAGVRLRRSFPAGEIRDLDPFLLFDHFGSDNPDDYIAGFPMHPHRGIETVTYMKAGVVAHRDSLGHAGTIGPGDVQWMTAGSGILHEEMPQLRGGRLDGFQLWVNLPAKLKMSPPRYQEFSGNAIPTLTCHSGAQVKVIAGEIEGVRGPVEDISIHPIYLDVAVPVGSTWTYATDPGATVLAYLYQGEGEFGGNPEQAGKSLAATQLVVFGDGVKVQVSAPKQEAHFLLMAGMPLKEPIVRHGPFVMNTEGEIKQALLELREGTFVK